MPKVRRTRTKLHASQQAPRHVSDRQFAVQETQVLEQMRGIGTENPEAIAVQPAENLHGLSKKEKRRLRHERWFQKLETKYNPKKNKKKSNTFSTEFLKTFSAALPEAKPSDPMQPDQLGESKEKKPLTKKARKNTAMKEIIRFQKVMQHPTYKENPLATIRQHVRNTMPSVEKR
ncbi:uncharacterized protein VTP21DRAFT_1043 [Calcarisporiella thermophila]|uniref:uncharacterized protein n=1 Tax=Calcarisporiella thermophila TaxID=911321 RepID=UPI0037440055